MAFSAALRAQPAANTDMPSGAICYPIVDGSVVAKAGRHKFTQRRILGVLAQLHRHCYTGFESRRL